jgi:hypothetical protein
MNTIPNYWKGISTLFWNISRITWGHKQLYKLQTFLEQDQKDLNWSDQHSGAKNLFKVFDFCMKIIFFTIVVIEKFVLLILILINEWTALINIHIILQARRKSLKNDCFFYEKLTSTLFSIWKNYHLGSKLRFWWLDYNTNIFQDQYINNSDFVSYIFTNIFLSKNKIQQSPNKKR